MLLVFDFDSTITKEDTIEVLAQAAIEFQRRERGVDLSDKWAAVKEEYGRDYERHKAAYPVEAAQRTSLYQEVDYLAAMNAVEVRSLKRVEESGLFNGLAESDLYTMGQEAHREGRIKIRGGFNDVITFASERNCNIYVLSVNWSRSFIRGALQRILPRVLLGQDAVISNEISAQGKIIGPASNGHQQLTGDASKSKIYNGQVAVQPEDSVCVYFGDSHGDLSCLLSQNGIVICNDTDAPLMSTLKRIPRSHPKHISLSLCCSALSGHEHRIYWARDFREVMDTGILAKAKGR